MFTEIKSTRIYEQVIDQIKEMVVTGKLRKGDKLPSERELTSKLGVSRSSIREAIRVLEVIGIVSCKQGDGNFIRTDFENILFEPLSIMFLLNKSSEREIFELRRVIEVETAGLAAKNITIKQLQEIRLILDDMEKTEDEDLKIKLDKKFHYKIAKASNNFLIVTVLNTISELIDSFIKDARAKILETRKEKNIIETHHEEIYDGLVNRDSKKCSEAMRKHMKMISECFIEE
ncbi:FadR/GntR family transcriptional regulator [Clostridium oceanicum]|uniref:FadR/GntR family transcriptional regulator n=1 Tax=Clostridium oceanicum TaxID=1543 RepID=A0ABP3URP4_9CLOT